MTKIKRFYNQCLNKKSYVFGIDYKYVLGVGSHKKMIASPMAIPSLEVGIAFIIKHYF